ncbi:MAG: pirin family protein [Magnetococcales bacterium]|nr:pirin family protein [Magnetococcales bacterium]
MIILRPARKRGAANHGWLDTRHTFSFAHYHDPAHMGFRSLRVINEDIIQPGAGFDTHGHQDMEVISYPLSGGLAHRDSTGSTSVIRPGQVQCMTAGRGIRHSEYNASDSEIAHFLQIWILPDQDGLEPGYEQKEFARESWSGRFGLIASPDGAEQSLTIHQDVRLLGLLLDKDQEAHYTLAPARHAWVQIARGQVSLNGLELSAGDGVAISGEPAVCCVGRERAELLLFDLA